MSNYYPETIGFVDSYFRYQKRKIDSGTSVPDEIFHGFNAIYNYQNDTIEIEHVAGSVRKCILRSVNELFPNPRMLGMFKKIALCSAGLGAFGLYVNFPEIQLYDLLFLAGGIITARSADKGKKVLETLNKNYETFCRYAGEPDFLNELGEWAMDFELPEY